MFTDVLRIISILMICFYIHSRHVETINSINEIQKNIDAISPVMEHHNAKTKALFCQ